MTKNMLTKYKISNPCYLMHYKQNRKEGGSGGRQTHTPTSLTQKPSPIEKLVFSKGVSPAKQTTPKGGPHAQQEVASRKRTQGHLWRLLVSYCCVGHFFKQVLCMYIWLPVLCLFWGSCVCQYVCLCVYICFS